MPVIITEEQFKSRYLAIKERFEVLNAFDKQDARWKKVGRLIKIMKQVYHRDKVYAVKYMNLLEKYQPSFQEEKRALIVRSIDLMQKVILHKKLNRKG